MLRRAEDRIDSMVQLIGDLLSLSRSEQAQGQAEPELLHVEQAASAVLELQAGQLAARRISASMEMEPGLPPVLVPPDDLSLILSNLIGNAVKYNRDGGSVTVRARHDGEWVRIDVEDTGIGIARENLIWSLLSSFAKNAPRPGTWKEAASVCR
jgi:signal transduction histidine kinase